MEMKKAGCRVVTDQPQPPWSQPSHLLHETQTPLQQGVVYPAQLPPERALFSQQLPFSVQLHSEPQASLPSESQTQHLPPLSESQLHNMSTELCGSAFPPDPVPSTQRAGEAVVTVVEHAEEGDMQDWVCLPEPVVSGLGLYFKEGSLSVLNDSTLAMQPNADSWKLRDGRAVDTGEKEQLEEDLLGLNCAPLLDERSGEGHLEAEMMKNKGIWSESLEDVLSELQKHAAAVLEDRSEVENDAWDGGEEVVDSENSLILGHSGSDVEATSSEAEKNQEDEEGNEQLQDFDGKTETRVSESEEKITSVSVQVSVIWFNLCHQQPGSRTPHPPADMAPHPPSLLLWVYFIFWSGFISLCCCVGKARRNGTEEEIISKYI